MFVFHFDQMSPELWALGYLACSVLAFSCLIIFNYWVSGKADHDTAMCALWGVLWPIVIIEGMSVCFAASMKLLWKLLMFILLAVWIVLCWAYHKLDASTIVHWGKRKS